jgi:hypothetical protein
MTSEVTRRTFLKGMGASGLVMGMGLPLFPSLWRQTGTVADPPFGLHLQFGAEPAREMTVSWVTPSAVANPRVRVGTSAGDLSDTVGANTKTYVDGPSGTQVFSQHSALTDLRPDTTYFYEALHDGAAPVKGQFRTAPVGRGRFSFTSFGDQSIPDALGTPPTQPWTRYAGLIVPQIEAAQPLFHLYNGDLCYANVAGRVALRVQTWRSFLTNNSRSARFRPWMPAAGNHENERKDGRPNADPFKAYQTYFSLPDNGAAADFAGLWYSFRVGSMLVISLNNDDVCFQDGGNTYVHGYSGGAQKAFLESTLKAARASNDIDWIVVVMHQVAISTAIPFNGCELGVRQEWLPLFDKYEVDLVVTGHEHHYERSFALRGQEGAYSRPAVASNDTDTIDTGAGTVHMVLGGGGHNSSSHDKYSIKDGAFEAEILAPTGASPATPGGPIPLITPKPREIATWSPTILSPDPTLSHTRDSGHGYGFATFDVNPGSERGGWTTITVRYQRVLDPLNPADTGKEVEFDSFTLRRRRHDGNKQTAARVEQVAAV